MAESAQSIIATRGAQMFPTLTDAEIARLRRFGTVRAYRAGEGLALVADPGHGLTICLAGEAQISQHDQSGARTPIVTHGPGSFMGGLAPIFGPRTPGGGRC